MATTHPMRAADAAWYRMDRPTNHMVINAVLTLSAPIDRDELRALMGDRIVARFPRYRQRIVDDALGAPQWEDDPHFDLDLHVHRRSLPRPGDTAALQELIADLMSAELDHNRPLWDLYLIEGFGQGCAVLARMHHCIADGIALAEVLLLLTDGHGDRARPIAAPRGRRLPGARVAGAAWALAHESVETALHPTHLVDLGREARDDVAAALYLLTVPPDPHTALKGEHGVAQRVAWTPPFSLPKIKATARATGTTINDVLVSALSGGLARFLAAHDEPIAQLHAMVPFNIRPADKPLPAELGNDFGLVILGLPLAADGPRDRLRQVHERMRAIKESRQPAVSYAILVGMGRAPAPVEKFAIDLFSAKCTAVVTNVPGPRERVTVAGVPVRDVLVWAPCAGSVGTSVSMFSYNDTVTVGFMTHASLVPEPQQLVDAFVAELRELERTGQRASYKRSKASR